MSEDEQVRRGCYRVLVSRPDIGSAKIISSWFFEPPNMFDPHSRKKPKREIIIVLIYVLLMTAFAVAFNFR